MPSRNLYVIVLFALALLAFSAHAATQNIVSITASVTVVESSTPTTTSTTTTSSTTTTIPGAMISIQQTAVAWIAMVAVITVGVEESRRVSASTSSEVK